eukprot:jgi/Botrbrau1/22146/Bobra.0206s0070.1
MSREVPPPWPPPHAVPPLPSQAMAVQDPPQNSPSNANPAPNPLLRPPAAPPPARAPPPPPLQLPHWCAHLSHERQNTQVHPGNCLQALARMPTHGLRWQVSDEVLVH